VLFYIENDIIRVAIPSRKTVGVWKRGVTNLKEAENVSVKKSFS
jgi:hypothetical protein